MTKIDHITLPHVLMIIDRIGLKYFFFQLDTYYLNLAWMRSSGFIRSEVVFFRQGSASQTTQDAYYVKATVVLLFRLENLIRDEASQSYRLWSKLIVSFCC
jgi:hypothetical protein